MPTPNSSNILFGAGEFYIGDYVAAAGTVTYVDVGHIQKAIKIGAKLKYKDVETQRAFSMVKRYPIGGELMIQGFFHEATLENMRIMLAQPSAQISGTAPNQTLLVGTPLEQYHAIKVIAPGLGSTKKQTDTFYKCCVDDPDDWEIDKENEQVYGVKFRILWDDSVTTADKFFKRVES